MLWETSQQLTNLPPIPHETRRFIAAFLNVDQDINALASELNEDFFDVVQRLTDPAVKAWIKAINALKSNERRERAMYALDLALTNEHPNHVRRAATRILRHVELTRTRPHFNEQKSTATPPLTQTLSNIACPSTPPPRQPAAVTTQQDGVVPTSPTQPVLIPTPPPTILTSCLIEPENPSKTLSQCIDCDPQVASFHPSRVVLSGFDPSAQPTFNQANIPSEEKRCFNSRHPPWSLFMGLDFAIDALYDTDFRAEDVVDCKVHKDGRAYPTVRAVGECFERSGSGYSLTIRHVQLFDCYRAEWRDGNGDVCGAVVGQTAEEAAVYALSLLRRQLQGV